MTKSFSLGRLFFAAILVLSACTNSEKGSEGLHLDNTASLRAMTTQEREADFDQLVTAIRSFYGPLRYKEKRFNFNFDELVLKYRALALQTTDDQAFIAVIKEFLTHFQDGHVSARINILKSTGFEVPLIVSPFENKAIVTKITNENLSKDTGIEVGDEVLEVDGKPTMSYLPTILKYESFANPVSNQHLIFKVFSRNTYLTELKPTKATVTLKIAKADGSVFDRNLIWQPMKRQAYFEKNFPNLGPFAQAHSALAQETMNQAGVAEFGDENPFYMTARASNAYQIVRVNPSEAMLKKYGLTDLSKTPKLYAALYRFEGKTLMLIRIATYSVSDTEERLAWYKAVLDEYGKLADALIIDQNHNPGGRIDYAQNIVSIFANQNTRGLVNFLHPDRRWLSNFQLWLGMLKNDDAQKSFIELAHKTIEAAYDKGLQLTETPLPFGGSDFIQPANFNFKKPVLLLADELAGSCGDIVPMLMKENGLAKVFGKRTMGLGGNVEEVVTLPSSQIGINLTRGFFVTQRVDGQYDMENMVENNGVNPDIEYTHTAADFRAGYVGYVKAFSKAAVELVK